MKTIQKYLLCLTFAILFAIVVLFENAKEAVPTKHESVKCGRFPKPTDIEFDNEMWQVHVNSDGLLFLWNAYLDLRWNKSVVINAIGAGINLGPENFFCQYWFKGRDDAIVVQASKFQNTWRTSESNLSLLPLTLHFSFRF